MKKMITIMSLLLISSTAFAASKMDAIVQEVYEITHLSGAYAINAEREIFDPHTKYVFNKSVNIDFIAEKNYNGLAYGGSNQLIVAESATIAYQLTDAEAARQIGDLMNKNSDIKHLSIRRDGFIKCKANEINCYPERKYIVSIIKTNTSGVNQATTLSFPSSR